jgi:hypothetical protein
MRSTMRRVCGGCQAVQADFMSITATILKGRMPKFVSLVVHHLRAEMAANALHFETKYEQLWLGLAAVK